jgi:hypothetical protein
MQENHYKKNLHDLDDEIDLRELFYVLLEGKWIIISVTAFVSIIGVIYSLSLPNIYKSKTLLSPVDFSSNISGTLQSYSGLAGLAGINIPNGSEMGNSAKAMEKISSLSFFENQILTNIYLPDLMAVKSWDPKKNTLIYDESIYEKSSDSWVRSFSYPKKQVPTPQESFKIFITKHMNATADKNSGFITISLKHQSPFVAKEWTELIVREINAFYRKNDKSESLKAISFLNQQISMTSLSEIKQVIANLLQEETKKLALIEANQYYVFDYIDPPAVMEQKSEPNRSIICILSAIFGGVLSTFLVIFRHYAFGKTVR